MQHNQIFVGLELLINYMIFGEIQFTDTYLEVVVTIIGIVLGNDTEPMKVVAVLPTGECDIKKNPPNNRRIFFRILLRIHVD